jgi:hypothetical protein
MPAHSALLFFGSMPAACYASTHNRHLPPHTGRHTGECLFTFVHIPLPLRGREVAKSENERESRTMLGYERFPL